MPVVTGEVVYCWSLFVLLKPLLSRVNVDRLLVTEFANHHFPVTTGPMYDRMNRSERETSGFHGI